jgi:single-stranded DNA-specific DHH superfamily exonuclease
MSLGIECLITDDLGRALNIAQQLDALNRERREIEPDMQEQALILLESASTRRSAPGSRCTTRPGTRASSASSPRASRTSCTAR